MILSGRPRASSKQSSNYCFYCDYLQKKGMLDQVRDFFEQCGGPNGDVPHHNFDKAMPWPFAEEDYIDVVTGRVAREQLSRHPAEKPFYMKVSFCGPHKPYDAPQRYLDMFPLEQEDDFLLPEGQVIAQKDKEALWRQRRSSKAMIKLIDDQIGEILRLLEKRGMMEDTLVLFTSDHGDMLGDHYLLQKGFPGDRRSMSRWQSACLGQNQQEKIRTRLNCPIWRQRYWTMQGWMRVRRSAAAGLPITISFHPVLCCPCCGERPTAAGIFALRESDFTEERVQGIPVTDTPYWRGAGGRRSNAWQAIITEKSKYIKYLGYALGEKPYEEFYDLRNDPMETANLIGDRPIQTRSSWHATVCHIWWIIIRRHRRPGARHAPATAKKAAEASS